MPGKRVWSCAGVHVHLVLLGSLLPLTTGCPALCAALAEAGIDICKLNPNSNDNTNDNANQNDNSNDNGNANDNDNSNDNGNGNDNTDPSVAGNNVFGLTSALVAAVDNPPRILAFADPAGLNDVAEPSAVLERETPITGFAFNALGELLVLTLAGEIEVFATPADIAAATPSRVATSPLLQTAFSMTLDRRRDLLYVSVLREGDNTVFAFGPTQSPDFDGAVAPLRKIANETFDNSDGFFYLDITPDDTLYVSRLPLGCDFFCPEPVLDAFHNASTLDGEVDPDRRITFTEFVGLAFPRVDSSGNLVFDGLQFPPDPNTEGIRGLGSIPNAAALDGEPPPSAFIVLPFELPAALAVDAAGTAYVGTFASGIFVYEDFPGRSGTDVMPDRMFQSTEHPLSLPTTLEIIE